MSIDLSGVQSFVEDNLMDDTCTIGRDTAGTSDDNWNATTGEYEADFPDEVYDGPCWVSQSGNQPGVTQEPGFAQVEELYFLNIPLGAPEVKDGDIIRITSSLRNPHLVDKIFRANVIGLGTFKVKQKVRMTRGVPQALR